MGLASGEGFRESGGWNGGELGVGMEAGCKFEAGTGAFLGRDLKVVSFDFFDRCGFGVGELGLVVVCVEDAVDFCLSVFQDF